MKVCLVVDDSDVIRKVTRRILEDLDFVAVEAENGQQALEHCRADMPDAVIVDWHMPVMGGVDFVEALRGEELGYRPRVLYCTTEHDPYDISRALEAGADEYIIKPFDKDLIEGKLHAVGLI